MLDIRVLSSSARMRRRVHRNWSNKNRATTENTKSRDLNMPTHQARTKECGVHTAIRPRRLIANRRLRRANNRIAAAAAIAAARLCDRLCDRLCVRLCVRLCDRLCAACHCLANHPDRLCAAAIAAARLCPRRGVKKRMLMPSKARMNRSRRIRSRRDIR